MTAEHIGDQTIAQYVEERTIDIDDPLSIINEFLEGLCEVCAVGRQNIMNFLRACEDAGILWLSGNKPTDIGEIITQEVVLDGAVFFGKGRTLKGMYYWVDPNECYTHLRQYRISGENYDDENSESESIDIDGLSCILQI